MQTTGSTTSGTEFSKIQKYGDTGFKAVLLIKSGYQFEQLKEQIRNYNKALDKVEKAQNEYSEKCDCLD